MHTYRAEDGVLHIDGPDLGPLANRFQVRKHRGRFRVYRFQPVQVATWKEESFQRLHLELQHTMNLSEFVAAFGVERTALAITGNDPTATVVGTSVLVYRGIFVLEKIQQLELTYPFVELELFEEHSTVASVFDWLQRLLGPEAPRAFAMLAMSKRRNPFHKDEEEEEEEEEENDAVTA